MESHSAQQQNAEMLAETIIKAGLPHKDSETRLLRFNYTTMGTQADSFETLLEELTTKVTKSKATEDIKNHRRCLRYILNNLVLCAFRFEWLVLPTTPNSFKEDEYLNLMGFSQRRMERCIALLCSEQIMSRGRKGHLGGKTAASKASQFYPLPAFIRMACSCLYSEMGNFDELTDEKLYQFKRFDEADIPAFGEYQSKLEILRDYNNYMREHSWAMKSPSHRTIKDFDCRSGRIFNHYQNLAERRVRIRSRTLLDGEPISEPDFSANHLRMASYLFGYEKLPDDPYSDIATTLNCSRDQIKRVVTESIGASSIRQKGMLFKNAHLHKIPIGHEQYKMIHDSLITEYPWLGHVFFHDFGSRLQYLEGEIALMMMQWSTQMDIPLIPVHDAFAVKEHNHQATYDKMLECWSIVMWNARKMDFIGTSDYTTAIVYTRNKGM